MAEYPTWICSDCGKKHGHILPTCATFNPNERCGWCGEITTCTEPRDYGYPKPTPVPARNEEKIT